MSGDEEAEEQDLLSEIRDLEASNEAMYVREAGSRARIQELERERDGLVEALGRVRDRQWGRVVLPGDATIEAVPLDEVRAVVDELGVVLPAGLEEIQRVDFPTGSQGIQVVEERDIQPFTDGEGVG